MPERRAGVEKAGFGRVVFFLRLRLAVGGLWSFFSKLAGRFFNGAEAELRRDGVAVFCGAVRFLPVFSCGVLLLFILVFAFNFLLKKCF